MTQAANDMSDERWLVGVFDDRHEAELAVDELEQAGVKHDQVGFAIRGSDAVRGGMITDAEGTKDGTGAVTGMVAGGITGGILAAAAALLVPGVGPVLAAGVFWTAMGGVAAGAATGGILGAMAGLGVSEDEARYYELQFQSGKAIVMVRPNGRANQATEILRRHGSYDITTRRNLPADASAGLSGFNSESAG